MHSGGEASTLDHEVLNHTVEDHAIVMTFLHVVEKVLNRLRSFLGIELDSDRAEVGDLEKHQGLRYWEWIRCGHFCSLLSVGRGVSEGRAAKAAMCRISSR